MSLPPRAVYVSLGCTGAVRCSLDLVTGGHAELAAEVLRMTPVLLFSALYLYEGLKRQGQVDQVEDLCSIVMHVCAGLLALLGLAIELLQQPTHSLPKQLHLAEPLFALYCCSIAISIYRTLDLLRRKRQKQQYDESRHGPPAA